VPIKLISLGKKDVQSDGASFSICVVFFLFGQEGRRGLFAKKATIRKLRASLAVRGMRRARGIACEGCNSLELLH